MYRLVGVIELFVSNLLSKIYNENSVGGEEQKNFEGVDHSNGFDIIIDGSKPLVSCYWITLQFHCRIYGT